MAISPTKAVSRERCRSRFPEIRGRIGQKRVLSRDLPMHWTGVAIALGGGADGEGARPLPDLGLIPTDCHPPVTPSPPAGTRTFLLKAPAPEGGQYVGIPGTSRLPGCKPLDSIKKDRYSPPVRVPVIGNRCTSPRNEMSGPGTGGSTMPVAPTASGGGDGIIRAATPEEPGAMWACILAFGRMLGANPTSRLQRTGAGRKDGVSTGSLIFSAVLPAKRTSPGPFTLPHQRRLPERERSTPGSPMIARLSLPAGS